LGLGYFFDGELAIGLGSHSFRLKLPGVPYSCFVYWGRVLWVCFVINDAAVCELLSTLLALSCEQPGLSGKG
jgi:hypothetical protein